MQLGDILKKLLFGNNGGLTYWDLADESYRDRISDYLTLIGLDEAARLYLLTDETVGYAWECCPLAFAGIDTINTLEGLFRMGLPVGSVMQFILNADDHVDPILDAHMEKQIRKSDLIQKTSKHFTDFFRESVKGFKKMNNIPLRNFRLFVTVKIPRSQLKNVNLNEIYNTMTEILGGARLSPVALSGEKLMEWLSRILNDRKDMDGRYDNLRPLRKQVVLAETDIRKESDRLRIGKKVFRCTTPKSYPKEVDPSQTNNLGGGVLGLISDPDQLRTPFLSVMNVVFEDMRANLHFKCNAVLKQNVGLESLAPALGRKKEEYKWAVDEVERGTPFMRILPLFFVYGDDDKEVDESIARAKRVHESNGYKMQEDKDIVPILFLSALPFGLINKGKNLDYLERDFPASAKETARVLPIQGDFSGSGSPALLYVGRKGQICPLDIFDPRSNNHNIFIAATSGSGKSFNVNYLIAGYFARGAKIRMVDAGHSYRKTTSMYGAKYIDFTNDICINPLSNISDPEFDIPFASMVIAQMAYSSSPTPDPTPTEMTIIEGAVKWAIKEHGEDANIDSVYSILSEYEKYVQEFNLVAQEDVGEIAKSIAFNIQKFTSGEIYGKYFNGRASLNIDKDPFVVLELEKLLQVPALFNVVTLQVVNLVTKNLYLSDRKTPVFIIFDEAHLFLKKSGIIRDAIGMGYRRARKYHGSFSIITQSILDLLKFGDVGEVILGNSAYKFYLESPDFDRAKAEKLINYDDFHMRILRSVQSSRPRYSEIFMDTPAGVGVARLIVGPWSYWAYTSEGREVAAIEELVKGGMSYVEAIDEMVRRSE